MRVQVSKGRYDGRKDRDGLSRRNTRSILKEACKRSRIEAFEHETDTTIGQRRHINQMGESPGRPDSQSMDLALN
ncbi:hypothetical protein [Cryobacterium sp. MLB-32]|uniref:hypothetical protein n=1 Tax=Cryobacterium sp. MLB-32 TaxID=1529318 RepID=UPI0018CEA8A9|nr:hypothetical protein [Cryobacterium sp. MLB-32]